MLRKADFALLEGKKVGLITNQSGVAADGESTIDILHSAPKVDLVALFSPEHGIRGAAENGVIVEDGRDDATGLPVHSLYGNTKKPSPQSLQGLDVLVFDIQDIGTRFYTYIATMGLAMEAAAEAGIGFVVLDRPNPIGGMRVEGPLPDGPLKFVCPHDIPIRHGMTVGELAQMFRQERGLGLDLVIVKMQQWSRGMWFDETDLPWRAPSPNMPDIKAAGLYPGIGILEFLALSVGRGTEAPFQTIGAPYIDGERLAKTIRDADIGGLEVEAIQFTPTKSTFIDEECGGVRLRVSDRDQCDVLHVGAVIATYIAENHYEESAFSKKMNILLVHPSSVRAMVGGEFIQLQQEWELDARLFADRRAPFLLY